MSVSVSTESVSISAESINLIARHTLAEDAQKGVRSIVKFEKNAKGKAVAASIKPKHHDRGRVAVTADTACPPYLRPRDEQGRFVRYDLDYGQALVTRLVDTEIIRLLLSTGRTTTQRNALRTAA
jgi:hypothetical protein